MLKADHNQRYQPQTVDQLSADLQGIYLPALNHADYVSGYGGCLVFLNDYGLVIRFEGREHQDFLNIESPYLLQPLSRVQSQNWVMEVCPALPLLSYQACSDHNYPVDVGTIQMKLNALLNKDGLKLWDMQMSNCGYMLDPSRDNEFTPIVIDRNAVDGFSKSILDIKRLFRGREKGPQDIFLPLRHAFETAAVATGEDQKQAYKKAYDLCRVFRKNQKLVCGWNDVNNPCNKTGRALKAAQSYQASVQTYHKKIFA